METQSWSQAGSLNAGRFGHAGVEIGSSFVIVGGSATHPTEKCVVNAYNEVQCSTQEPTLTKYYAYPEVFYVPFDFCN